ncbi:hypothetical protein CapIbe_007190 [Capra ibex]
MIRNLIQTQTNSNTNNTINILIDFLDPGGRGKHLAKSIMHPWVAILGLLLLLTDGVTSYSQVTGVAGQSIRLPCSYTGEITSACWGRGKCSWLSCGTDIIQTDGYNVIFQKDRRYQLKGYIGERDLSLTIEDADPSDSGLYCCRIEKRGWFNDIKIMQELSIRTGFSGDK